MLARAHSFLDRHPLVSDAVLAAGLLAFAISALFSDGADPGTTSIVLSVLLTAPLALRRRHPVAVFAAVMLACGAQLLLVDEFLAANAGALVALYTLVAYAPRRLAAIGVGIALAGAVPSALRFDESFSSGPLLTWLVLVLHIVLAAALGDRMHARVRDRESLRERARMLAAERDQQAQIAAAAERTRIARELHDVVAHSLSVVIAQADGGRYAAGHDPGAAISALQTIAKTAREAQAEMRRALGVLGDRPDELLRPQPGVEELDELVAGTREAGLTVRLVHEGLPRPLAPASGLAVYRVVQEALTNVLKHAGPRASARVVLGWEADHVTLLVRDDGTGAAAPGDGRGRGVAGMRERVHARGGTFSAGRAGGGFEVWATIPADGAPARAPAETRS